MIALLSALQVALAGSVQLDTFDRVVERVPAVQHADWSREGWDAAAERLRKKARKASTAAELRPILLELLGTLEVSHYAILPGSWDGDALPSGGPGASGGATAGLAFAALDDGLVIWRVAPGSPAEEAGIRPGAVVTAVGGDPVEPARTALFAHQDPPLADLMLRAWARSRVDGLPDGMAALSLEDGREVEIGRITQGVFQAPPIGRMPGHASVWTEHPLPLPDRDQTARYVAFEVFVPPVVPRFGEAIATARQQDAALVIDLRGNPGGVIAVGQGIMGHLVPKVGTLGKTRSGVGELELMVNPRPRSQRFDGPVALLVDRGSASTSEIVAVGLAATGRARVFGSRTAGMALPSHFEDLPNGDVLQLATGEYTRPDGTTLEGIGFTPDEEVPLTRDALAEGRDPVLEAALRWLSGQVPHVAESPVTEDGEPR